MPSPTEGFSTGAPISRSMICHWRDLRVPSNWGLRKPRVLVVFQHRRTAAFIGKGLTLGTLALQQP